MRAPETLREMTRAAVVYKAHDELADLEKLMWEAARKGCTSVSVKCISDDALLTLELLGYRVHEKHVYDGSNPYSISWGRKQ